MTRSVQLLPHDLLAKLFPLVGEPVELAGLCRMIDRQHFQKHDFSIKSRKPSILSFLSTDHPQIEVQGLSAGDAMLVDFGRGHEGSIIRGACRW